MADARWTAETEDLVARAEYASDMAGDPDGEHERDEDSEGNGYTYQSSVRHPCPEIRSLASRLGVSVDG